MVKVLARVLRGRLLMVLVLVLVLVVAGCAPARDTPSASQVDAYASRPGIAGLLRGDDRGFARADRARTFSFPADDGAHPEFRTEWWYLTGQLIGTDHQRFGFQFTVFRQALAPSSTRSPSDAHARQAPEVAPASEQASEHVSAHAGDSAWRTRQGWLAHLAITDIDQQKHWVATRLARGALGMAGATTAPFAVWVEDWRLAQSAAAAQWQLLAKDEQGLELELQVRTTQPEVLHGQGGWSRKGVQAASYYFSRPRLQVTGYVRTPGHERTAVRGTAWLDREWSTSALAPEQIGWDWFALQLGDGRSLMLFQLRHRDGKRDAFDAGTLVDRDGAATALGANDFTLLPGRRWRDEQGVEWPVAWRLTLRGVAKATQIFAIDAAVDDQLMRVGLRYWEGAVTVTSRGARLHDGAAGAARTGAAPARTATGEGYLEMTGYTTGAQ